jgi:hypothetical protein
MTPPELAALGFVRRLFESARERAGRAEDQELHDLLSARIAALGEGCQAETLRRKQDLSKIPGVVLRLMPPCGSASLRSTICLALSTTQLLLPQLPPWALREIRHVEAFCQESIRHAGGGEGE